MRKDLIFEDWDPHKAQVIMNHTKGVQIFEPLSDFTALEDDTRQCNPLEWIL